MKRTHEPFDPGARMVPRDWISLPRRAGGQHRGHGRDVHKWMTTLPAPFAKVHECALQALESMNATLAYRFETEDKVVIRATLLERQIRAELKPAGNDATRIVVVTLRGTEVDRLTSGLVVEAIELQLRDAGYPA
jgi:hypothetical protein